MMNAMQPEQDDGNDYNIFDQTNAEPLEVAEQRAPSNGPVDFPKKKNHPKRLRRLIIGAVVGAVIVTVVIVGMLLRKPSKTQPTNITINTQSLDNGTLNQLTATNGGQAKQQLTISPDTLFKNSVEVQKNIDVDGVLTAKGQSNLQGPVVAQDSVLFQKGLTVTGGTTIGGNLTVGGAITAKSLSVGTLTISSVNVSSDVTFAGHLIPNGVAPAAKPSLAASGGNVVISGNDTAGTLIINVGNGALQTGEMAIITFHTPFATTPKIQLTPVNAATSNIHYYVSRSATFFTINTSSMPANGGSYVFDYLVTQ